LEKTEPKKTAENRTDFSKEKAPKMKIKKDERARVRQRPKGKIRRREARIGCTRKRSW